MDSCIDEALAAALDNPFWSALATRHAGMAQRVGDVACYPADVAPFLGVARVDADVEDALASLVGRGEERLLLGVIPVLSSRWHVQHFRPLAQLVCETPVPVPDGPVVTELGAPHRGDVLDLVGRVYPHYFRPRTMALGRYFGIYVDGRLAAMAGERLGTQRAREISAVCSDPEFSGRGYARRLLAMLANDHLARGWLPFLHVSQDNRRALDLYRSIGWRVRCEIAFASLRRTDSEYP